MCKTYVHCPVLFLYLTCTQGLGRKQQAYSQATTPQSQNRPLQPHPSNAVYSQVFHDLETVSGGRQHPRGARFWKEVLRLPNVLPCTGFQGLALSAPTVGSSKESKVCIALAKELGFAACSLSCVVLRIRPGGLEGWPGGFVSRVDTLKLHSGPPSILFKSKRTWQVASFVCPRYRRCLSRGTRVCPEMFPPTTTGAARFAALGCGAGAASRPLLHRGQIGSHLRNFGKVKGSHSM